MSIQLPPAIAAFFDGDRKSNAQAVAECFSQDAVVLDEGNTYEGRDAIRTWMANASTQYTYTSEPFSIEQENGRTVVSSHLIGNFPGSPVDLRYFFVIHGDKITNLEIKL
jgi:SnoaL-like domain